MEFVTVTKIPPRRGLLGTVPGKNVIEEVEAESLMALRESLHIPLDGECLVVEKQNVTTIKPFVVNEIRNYNL